MRALVWGLALWATPLLGQSAPPIAHVKIDSFMLRHLEQIAETAHVETARCLVGWVKVDTVMLSAAAETPWLIKEQTDSTVLWRWWDCPGSTLALWHTHLWRRSRGLPPSETCWISSPDLHILSLIQSPPLAAVSVRRGVSCLFIRLPDGTLGRVGTPQ